MKSISNDLPHPSPNWHCDLYSDTLGVAIKVEKILFHEQTPFQDVKICRTVDFGKVLLLNNYIYRSEIVHYMVPEMLAHIPMRSGGAKRRVLLIGGGDGYTAKELTRYDHLETIDVIDIDQRVVDACREYFPVAAEAFSDPRVHLHICDGYDFVRNALDHSYDLILTTGTEGKNLDGSPGISYSLFQDEFFMECVRCLTDEGIFLIDASTALYDIGGFDYAYLTPRLQRFFRSAKTYILANGALIGGLFAITIASNGCDPENDITDKYDYIRTRYYNRHIHKGAFALPQIMLDKIAASVTS